MGDFMKKFTIIFLLSLQLCLQLSGCSSYLKKSEYEALTYPLGNPPQNKEYTDAGWVNSVSILRDHFDLRLKCLEAKRIDCEERQQQNLNYYYE
jgi:uncharacterized protein YceK